jgi:hypothetical protein
VTQKKLKTRTEKAIFRLTRANEKRKGETAEVAPKAPALAFTAGGTGQAETTKVLQNAAVVKTGVAKCCTFLGNADLTRKQINRVVASLFASIAYDYRKIVQKIFCDGISNAKDGVASAMRNRKEAGP